MGIPYPQPKRCEEFSLENEAHRRLKHAAQAFGPHDAEEGVINVVKRSCPVFVPEKVDEIKTNVEGRRFAGGHRTPQAEIPLLKALRREGVSGDRSGSQLVEALGCHPRKRRGVESKAARDASAVRQSERANLVGIKPDELAHLIGAADLLEAAGRVERLPHI